MTYKVKITQVLDKKDDDRYAPEKEIYVQEFSELNVLAVIKAANNIGE